MDLLATCAELVGQDLPEDAGEDSESILPIFYAKEPSFSRKGLIHHSVSGHFAYREGNYKLTLSRGSGGWTSPGEGTAAKMGLPKAQLYDIAADPGEQNNLYTSQPEMAEALLAQLTEYVNSGSTVEGKSSKNDAEEIVIWKGTKKKRKK